MKKEYPQDFCRSICMLAAFLLWTAAVRFVDVQTVGPQETEVGFATMNRLFHDFTGVHMALYVLTDWLSLVPMGCIFVFALLGLVQWVQRKHLLKVDYSILVLGGFYVAVMTVYVLFEMFVVNYRPVLINGSLEASYPSSTTMLVMCVMPTAAMQLHGRIGNKLLRGCVITAMTVFTVFMVIGRLISGVHWLTDIIGGVLLSTGLVLLYRGTVSLEA